MKLTLRGWGLEHSGGGAAIPSDSGLTSAVAVSGSQRSGDAVGMSGCRVVAVGVSPPSFVAFDPLLAVSTSMGEAVGKDATVDWFFFLNEDRVIKSTLRGGPLLLAPVRSLFSFTPVDESFSIFVVIQFSADGFPLENSAKVAASVDLSGLDKENPPVSLVTDSSTTSGDFISALTSPPILPLTRDELLLVSGRGVFLPGVFLPGVLALDEALLVTMTPISKGTPNSPSSKVMKEQ